MIFTANKKLIMQVVAFAKQMTNPKSTLPILSSVCFRSVNDETMCAMATNTKQYIRLYFRADVKELGEVALPAGLLSELLSTLPDEPVRFEVSERTRITEIRCARHKSTIKGDDTADLPLIPEIGELPTVDINPNVLIDMLTGVIDCASDDDSRQSLSLVNVTQENGLLSAVATDGYRLGMTSTQVTPYPINALIPRDSIVALSKLLPQAGGVKMATNDRHAMFFLDCQGDIDEILFASTLMDTNYPNYEAIIPKKHSLEAQIEVTPFVKALRLAKIFTDKEKSVMVDFLPPVDNESTGKIEVSVSGMDGDYRSVIPAIVSDSLKIHLSGDYMLDALSTCPTERVGITCTTSRKPISLHPCGDRSSEWYHLVMPMEPK